MPDSTAPDPSIDRVIQQHERAGVVGATEATDWAWSHTPMAPDELLVLLAVARHVHIRTLDALPALLLLDQSVVRDATLDLIGRQLLCPTVGGGVHVTLDCNCDS